MGRRHLALAALIALAACSSDDSWFGAAEDPPLPGERVSVMLLERELSADPSLADLPIELPPPRRNDAWPQSGGDPTHVMHHLAAGDQLNIAWRAGIGTGSPGEGQLLARPVVAERRVFTMDADGTIRAFDADSGALLWQFEQDDDYADGLIGGGLAFANGRLFATLSSGDVVALGAASGTEMWRQSLGVPLRAAPTVAEDRVLVLTADNQLYALDGTTGRPAWRHAGFFEGAGLLGGPSPAVDRGLVVVPYSSAEVYAIRLDNGRPLWSDTVERPRRTQALDEITDIDGMPVIDGEVVYVAGYGGQMAAIDARRGIRRWDVDVASTDTPWLAGDFLYVLTTRGEVVCLLRSNGRIRWVSPLPRVLNPDDPGSTPIVWSGPLLVGDRLLVAGSHGQAITMSPYTGEILGRQELPGPVVVPPVAAAGTVYMVTENAQLLAYR
jgi:outer membrane protein assembly factor BamB